MTGEDKETPQNPIFATRHHRRRTPRTLWQDEHLSRDTNRIGVHLRRTPTISPQYSLGSDEAVRLADHFPPSDDWLSELEWIHRHRRKPPDITTESFSADIPREAIEKELDQQKRKLRELGITEVRVGTEIEIPMRENPLDVRQTQWMSTAGTYENPPRNARETIHAEIFREYASWLLPPPGGHIEDNPGVMEIRLRAVDPATAARRHDIILGAIQKRMTEYGMDGDTLSRPNTHLNVSFWKGSQNITDPSHPEFTTTTARILRGITRAVFDAAPMQYPVGNDGDPGSLRNKKLPQIDAGPSRIRALRLGGGSDRLDDKDNTARIQLMLAPQPQVQNIGLITSAIMSGAITALSPEPAAQQFIERHTLPVLPTKRPFCEYRRDDVPHAIGYITHIVNGCEIAPDGRLIPHLPYIASEGPEMAKAFGLKALSPEDAVQKVTRIMQNTHIHIKPDGNLAIEWPKKLISKEKLAWIDENMKLARISPSLTIPAGYEQHAHSKSTSAKVGERVARMINSLSNGVLAHGYSQDFNHVLQTAALGHFQEPSGEARQGVQKAEMDIAKNATKSVSGHHKR